MAKFAGTARKFVRLGGAYYGAMTYLGHLSGVKDDLTAIENLRISSALAGAEIDEHKAHDALQRMGLGGRELLPAKVLSQGQRRRVTLARLMVCEPCCGYWTSL